jgi:hypothetical protein
MTRSFVKWPTKFDSYRECQFSCCVVDALGQPLITSSAQSALRVQVFGESSTELKCSMTLDADGTCLLSFRTDIQAPLLILTANGHHLPGSPFCLEYSRDRILCLSPSGLLYVGGNRFVRSQTIGGEPVCTFGPFQNVGDVCVSRAGEVFVHDRETIIVFNEQGDEVRRWVSDKSGHQRLSFCERSQTMYAAFHQDLAVQSAKGKLLQRWARTFNGVAVDQEDGLVYATDRGQPAQKYFTPDAKTVRDPALQVFTPEGKLLRQWGDDKKADNALKYPEGVAVHGDRVYVCDRGGGGSVKLFTRHGVLVGSIVENLSIPQKVCVSSDGAALFVLDAGSVRRFRKPAPDVDEWEEVK